MLAVDQKTKGDTDLLAHRIALPNPYDQIDKASFGSRLCLTPLLKQGQDPLHGLLTPGCQLKRYVALKDVHIFTFYIICRSHPMISFRVQPCPALLCCNICELS